MNTSTSYMTRRQMAETFIDQQSLRPIIEKYGLAKAYKDVLPYYEHLFKVIEFAIFSPKGKPTDNYDAFKKEFTK